MSWNPVSGCSKVSQGCKFCYAERSFPRAYGSERKFTEVQCHPDRLKQPITWRQPSKIFVNSMSDLFHEDVPFAFIDRIFGVMAVCPQHRFQILTKRPERMREYLSTRRAHLWAYNAGAAIHELAGGDDVRIAKETERRLPRGFPDTILGNVWLGTSVEDQKTADERLPILRETPAAIRFVSCEPLLSPVHLGFRTLSLGPGVVSVADVYVDGKPTKYTRVGKTEGAALAMGVLDWVIVGGESGPHARPFNIEWARSIIAQCRDAGVACFVKQLGAKPMLKRARSFSTTGEGYALSIRECEIDTDIVLQDRKGENWSEWPADLRVREFPEVRM